MVKCINDITNLIRESNPNTLWELIQGAIRHLSIKYATHKKKEERNLEETFISKIENLERLL